MIMSGDVSIVDLAQRVCGELTKVMRMFLFAGQFHAGSSWFRRGCGAASWHLGSDELTPDSKVTKVQATSNQLGE